MKRITYISALLLTAATAGAQAPKDTTMNRTVVVENQYNPYLMTASKLNLFPAVEEPKATTHGMEYARSLRPVSDWGENEMPLLERLYKEEAARRGYVRLGYGTRGRLDAAAGYTADLTDKDRLTVDMNIGGWDGRRPALNGNGHWTSRLYRSRALLVYRHRFQQWDLTAGAEWQNTVFNYQSLTTEPAYPHQHYTAADFHVGAATSDKQLPLQFTLQTGLRTFSTGLGLPTEKQVHTTGDVWAPVNDEQRVGVAFGMDNIFYTHKNEDYHPDNYTSLTLNPYYAYETADWRLRLGVQVDPVLGGTDKGLDLAPDIRAERVFNGNSVLYLHLLGGRELNDYRRVTGITPYVLLPWVSTSTYVPLHATLGFKISPIPGAWLHVFGGYQIRYDELFSMPEAPFGVVSWNEVQNDAKLAFGGAEIKYAYKDVVDIAVKGHVYKWELDEGDNALLAYKPRYDMHIEAQGKVWEGLRILAGYEWVDRRQDTAANVQNLYTGATYDLVHHLTVFVHVNNLLNKEYIDRNLCPAEKIGFLAGVRWEF